MAGAAAGASASSDSSSSAADQKAPKVSLGSGQGLMVSQVCALPGCACEPTVLQSPYAVVVQLAGGAASCSCTGHRELITLPPHPALPAPAQVVVCSGQVLKTCCAIPIPSSDSSSASASSAADASASSGSGGSRLSGSGSSASAASTANAVAALPAKACAAGDSVCDQAAALLAAQEKPAVPELVCKVGSKREGGVAGEAAQQGWLAMSLGQPRRHGSTCARQTSLQPSASSLSFNCSSPRTRRC